MIYFQQIQMQLIQQVKVLEQILILQVCPQETQPVEQKLELCFIVQYLVQHTILMELIVLLDGKPEKQLQANGLVFKFHLLKHFINFKFKLEKMVLMFLN